MDVRKLKNKFIEANIVTEDIKVIFRLPNCKSYDDCNCHIENINGNNVLVVDLLDKIEPIFKVGDIVTNSSGLYPNVKCTIAEVNEELQYYCYKEVNGRTYFKDQDKLTLVNGEEVRPPVEGEDKLDILSECYALNAKINVLKYNIEHYPLIYNVLKQIIDISKEGAISYHLVVPMKKEADEAGVYYEEDEVCGIIRWHFDKLGYKIEEKVKDNYNEFFITW